MVGTTSALDAAPRPRAMRTTGVGYQPGEPYAKWGRFACNLPAGFATREYAGVEAAATRSPPRSSRHRPRPSAGGTNDDIIGEAEAACVVGGVHVDGGGLLSSGDSHHKPEGEEVRESTDAEIPTSSHRPPVRGAPAYLQV